MGSKKRVTKVVPVAVEPEPPATPEPPPVPEDLAPRDDEGKILTEGDMMAEIVAMSPSLPEIVWSIEHHGGLFIAAISVRAILNDGVGGYSVQKKLVKAQNFPLYALAIIEVYEQITELYQQRMIRRFTEDSTAIMTIPLAQA